MKNHWFQIFALSILILAAGCSPSGEPKAAAEKLRSVRTQTIQHQDLPILVHAVGRLVPDREVVVSAQVTGIVKQLNADVGTKTAADDILVRLDPLDYTLALNETEANLLSAQARLSAAEKSYQRAQRLLPEKAISLELFDATEAEFRSSRAQVSQLTTAVHIARQRLNKTAIHSPFDGHVTRRMVELGQNVAVGEPVMEIADMKAMRVRIYINEQDYVHLDKQDPVTVTVEAYPETPVTGRIDKIGIMADPRTNTFEVELLLENPGFRFKAGLTARVSIQTDVIADAVMIPQGSVLFRENHQEVFVVEPDGLAAVRKVKLGRAQGSVVRILQGLQPGDNLVVAGAQYLKNGEKVVVKP